MVVGVKDGKMDGWVDGKKQVLKEKKLVLTCLVICTKQEQIYRVNWHSLLFFGKKYGPGWMDGWMDGWVEGWMGRWMDRWLDGRAGLRIA